MDEIIRQMAQGYIDTFKAYDVSGTPLKDEIDEWIEKFKGFAAGVSDPSKFYESFVASGMQEEHSALITKAAMQAMQGGSDQSTATSGAGGSGQRVGVREFLDQYRAAYDEIKKAGYRKRGEWMRLWLLNPKAVDALARVKMVLAPSNFEVYRDVVENEILPDIPMEQIVLREPPVLVSFALDDSGGYAKFAEGEAKKLNQGRAYFRYLDQLGGEAARLVSMPDALKKDK